MLAGRRLGESLADEAPEARSGSPEGAAGAAAGVVSAVSSEIGRRRNAMTAGVVVLVFVLGLICGFPVAIFGIDYLTANAMLIFGILFGLLLVMMLVAGGIVLFRRRILSTIFRVGEVEMERFAAPLANVARFAALQRVGEATDAARQLAELVLARYAWVTTRRWLLATITAFIAAIAALAGSALLFQQNQLLRVQSDLMADQTERLGEQNRLLESQIALGEAQRSAAILPEILDIGAAIGGETAGLTKAGRATIGAQDLSVQLRARLVAASTASRPYRYLRSTLSRLNVNEMAGAALARRTDSPELMALAQSYLPGAVIMTSGAAAGEQLADRPLSPERGQLISLLEQAGVADTEQLSYEGADFSFADVTAPEFGAMSLRMARMVFADLSNVTMEGTRFDGASMEMARFQRSKFFGVSFDVAEAADLNAPYLDENGPFPTFIPGADFSGATIIDTSFIGAIGMAANFDGAALHDVDFSEALLIGATFRGAMLSDVTFELTTATAVLFDDAIVFDEDFLQKLAGVAGALGVDVSSYVLEPLTQDELMDHPLYQDIYLARGGDIGTPRKVVRRP
jgi:uncharacterized protein YjbI with pentapeptide repeats